MNERLLQVKEAAEYTGTPRDYLLNQAKTGHITHVQPSAKKILFRRDDLDRWMQTWKEVAAS